MKLFTTYLFLFLCSIAFSQEYKFNLLTSYNLKYNLGSASSFKEVDKNRLIYSNSNDTSYFLLLDNEPNQNSAHITDLKNNKIHFLKLKEIKSKEEQFVTFEYLRTENLVHFDVNKKVVVEFETIKQDSTYKTVKMTIFKNSKKKKIQGISELIIKNHPKKLFPLFRFSCMHTLEYRTEIDFGDNGIVESSKSLTNNNYRTKLNIQKEINLTLKIPNKK